MNEKYIYLYGLTWNDFLVLIFLLIGNFGGMSGRVTTLILRRYL